MSGWEMAELDADRHRNIQRAAMQAKREARFWPPVLGFLMVGGFALVGLIENGYIQ